MSGVQDVSGTPSSLMLEVEITAEDLRQAGYMHKDAEPDCQRRHCDDGDCDPCNEDHIDEGEQSELLETVTRWHHDDHDAHGQVRFCSHPVCQAMSRYIGQRL